MDDSCRPSAVYTASQNAIITGKGKLWGVMVTTDGTNAPTLSIFDSLTQAGSKMMPDPVFPAAAAVFSKFQMISLDCPIAFNTGLSVTLTLGAGTASYQLLYQE